MLVVELVVELDVEEVVVVGPLVELVVLLVVELVVLLVVELVVVADVVVVVVVGVRTFISPPTTKILSAIFTAFSPEAERFLISTGIEPALASELIL